MASVNKVILVGRLGKDPEVRYMPNGDAVANITLATSESWKDKNGEKQEKTEWHRITFYRKLAEIVGEWLNKGSMIYVEGRLETRKWTDKSGVEKYTTEVIASQMVMLGSRTESHERSGENGSGASPEYNSNPAGRPGGPATPPSKQGKGDFADFEDDIPF